MNHLNNLLSCVILFSLISQWGCSQKEVTLFKTLDSEQIGIDFINEIDNTDSINILNYIYYYNGGGVGAGDFNNDGLVDLFFTGNKSEDELYLNQGNWKFSNVTDHTGIDQNGWSTGVNVMDINQDGWLDLYVCRAGAFKDPNRRKNVLYINQKDGSFIEKAKAYGIDDTANSTHSIFFDFDRDGDLDLYVMNHGNERRRVNTPVSLKNDGSDESVDHLYRNDNGRFENISIEAGILHEGYGLGLAVHDFNSDGWPDIFVANDFIFSDLVYINNADGTFSEQGIRYLSHQSYSSMGCDLGDINNDGRLDLLTLDMLPWTNQRQKTMMGAMNYNKYHTIVSNGYAHQYMRNILHMNLGQNPYNEIGRYAGIQATDWSWTPLFADFDHDGFTDLFISNGYFKDITDKDYIKYSNNLAMFKSAELADSAILASLEDLKEVKLPNFTFKNNCNLNFSDVSREWLNPSPTLSNGSIYADLDNDGDLDLVTNNINDHPGIYENTLASDQGHYLKLALRSNSQNRNAIGASVKLISRNQTLVRLWQPSRGYQGSGHAPIHFGLGANQKIDSLLIYWPDGTSSRHLGLPLDTTLVINQPEDLEPSEIKLDITSQSTIPGLEFRHKEDHFVDFHVQPLIPKKMSHEGPALAIGDLNDDGMEDVFVGGAGGQSSSIFYQTNDGFSSVHLSEDSIYEDTDAVIADFDGDGKNDLFVARGGYQNLETRLYHFDTNGNPVNSSIAIPNLNISSSTLQAEDVDQDGDLDVFVGGRFKPASYPESPLSALLLNQGDSFIMAPGWPRKLGMITDAQWADIDQNGSQDLVLVGEWMELSVLKNLNGTLDKPYPISDKTGFWQSIEILDLDNDGDMDIAAGNYGTNNSFYVSEESPLQLLAADFDNNGSVDPILLKQYADGRYPIAPRDAMMSQLPYIQTRVLSYRDYGRTPVKQLFTNEELSREEKFEVNELRSGVFINHNNEFEFTPFPAMAQLGPIRTMAQVSTSNELPGLILAGNDHQIEVLEGRQDAQPGLFLEQVSPLNFQPKRLFPTKDVRQIAPLTFQGKSYWILAQNDHDLLILER